jgi:hypothetical protein
MDRRGKRRLALRLVIVAAIPLTGAVVATRFGYVHLATGCLAGFYVGAWNGWAVYSKMTGTTLSEVFALLKGRSILTGRHHRESV